MEYELANHLHNLMKRNIVEFTFRKKDGTIRHARGTRNLEIASVALGYAVRIPKGEEQPNSYYDVEVMGWRSYKPENLISIDGVYAREDTDFAKKPTTPNVETKRGELPKREIPVQKPVSGGIDIGKLFGGLFGGVGFGDRDFGGGTDEIPVAKVGKPIATDKGLELPLGDVSVDAFARLVARYVVDELINRLK